MERLQGRCCELRALCQDGRCGLSIRNRRLRDTARTAANDLIIQPERSESVRKGSCEDAQRFGVRLYRLGSEAAFTLVAKNRFASLDRVHLHAGRIVVDVVTSEQRSEVFEQFCIALCDLRRSTAASRR